MVFNALWPRLWCFVVLVYDFWLEVVIVIRVYKHNYKIKITSKLQFNRFDQWEETVWKTTHLHVVCHFHYHYHWHYVCVRISAFISMVRLKRAKRWISYIIWVWVGHIIFSVTLAKNAELLIWVNHQPFTNAAANALLCVRNEFHLRQRFQERANEIVGQTKYNTIASNP